MEKVYYLGQYLGQLQDGIDETLAHPTWQFRVGTKPAFTQSTLYILLFYRGYILRRLVIFALSMWVEDYQGSTCC